MKDIKHITKVEDFFLSDAVSWGPITRKPMVRPLLGFGTGTVIKFKIVRGSLHGSELFALILPDSIEDRKLCLDYNMLIDDDAWTPDSLDGMCLYVGPRDLINDDFTVLWRRENE